MFFTLLKEQKTTFTSPSRCLTLKAATRKSATHFPAVRSISILQMYIVKHTWHEGGCSNAMCRTYYKSMEEMLAYTQTEDCYAHWSKTQRKHYKANELRLGKIKSHIIKNVKELGST